MPFETKGIRKRRSYLFGIIVGILLGLAFVEGAGNIFGVELEMDVDLSRLGQCRWRPTRFSIFSNTFLAQ